MYEDFEREFEKSRRQERRIKSKAPSSKTDARERRNKGFAERDFDASEPDVIFGKVIHISDDSILTLQVTRQEYSNKYMYQPVEKAQLSSWQEIEHMDELLNRHVVCEVHGRSRSNVLEVLLESSN